MSIAHQSERRIPPSTLPKRLRDAREWRGLTQADLAETLDVERTTISNYERGVGKKGISKLQLNAWAVRCDVDVEWLKTGREQPQTNPDGPGIESRLSESNRRPSHYKSNSHSVVTLEQKANVSPLRPAASVPAWALPGELAA